LPICHWPIRLRPATIARWTTSPGYVEITRSSRLPPTARHDTTHLWRPPDPPEPEVRESTLALLAVVVLVILLAGGITGG
jgi:hypothetical protein